MTQPPTQPAGPQASDDPLASLHKMSRTAGLASQDYVAINPTAVVGLLLGIASGLAVLGTILLVLPALAAVVCVVALRQISHSAGTQTGRGMAWLGLVLAVACLAIVGGRKLLHDRQVRAEQGQIVALIEQLGANLSKGDYSAAWGQFSDRFHERVPRDVFDDTWTRLQASPLYGKIVSMRWNGRLEVEIDRSSDTKTAIGVIILQLPDGRTDRRSAGFRKEQGTWTVEQIEGYFPDRKPPARQPS